MVDIKSGVLRPYFGCSNERYFVGPTSQWRTQEFCSGGGGSKIQLRAEDRQKGDLGTIAPYSGVLETAVIWYKKFHFI